MSRPNAEPMPPAAAGRWYRSPWLWAAVGGVIILTLLRPYCARRSRRVPKPPPVVGQVPTFQLTDQHGKPYGSAQLAGRVYVVNFVFTRCRSICPRMTTQMKKLQTRFAKAGVPIELVSISVDPEHDLPPVLLAYAKKQGADPKRWHFLTGPLPKVHRLLSTGFKVHMGDKEVIKAGPKTKPGDELIDIAHTSRFVIVDRKGGIRGSYSSDDDGIDEIFHRAQHVLHAKD